MSNDPSNDSSGTYDPIDTTKASVARAYDYVLGGKDNFEADRKFAEKIIARDPEIRLSARLNKDFGRRVVDRIIRRDVTQFLDLGSGIPTSPPSVHDTARRVNEEARVVYVDHDPVVVVHNLALRATGPGLAVIHDSFINMDDVFNHEDFTSTLDLTKPVAVLLLSVLQNYDDDQVSEIMADLRSRLAPGSYLAITHISTTTAPDVREAIASEIAAGHYPPTQFRSNEQLAKCFAGFELEEPGVVDFRDWHPDTDLEDQRPELKLQFSCGVGRLL